jgi:PAS domain S-box-containing protein
MLDPTGIVTSWNAGARRFKGYEASEIIGQHFSRFYTDEDRAVNLPQFALATAAAEGKFEQEGWRVRKDGTRMWAHVVIDAIRGPAGEIVGFAKITRDLTERKAAETSLIENERQFRLLVQGVTDYGFRAGTSARNGSRATYPRKSSGNTSRDSTPPKIGRTVNPPRHWRRRRRPAATRARPGTSGRTDPASWRMS